ncbi:MAG: hypothetical protein J6Y13_07300, partial [Treponema sp.]|nr:hypothetical protein [Treponema sp.]
NATNFVLQLTEVAADGTPVTGKTQTFPAQFAGSGESSDVTYVSGSLIAGADNFTVRLPANHLYEATIKARSARGRESAVTARTAASGTKTGCTGFGTERINQLLRIFDLNGGSYTDGDGAAHTGTFYDWNTYKDADIALLPLANVVKSYGSTDYTCTGWKASGTAGTVYTGSAPAGFVAGTYTAVYPSSSVSVTIVGHADLAAGDVTLTGGTADGTDKYKIASNEALTVAIADSANRFAGYMITSGNAIVYQEGNSSGSFIYTIPGGTFNPGSYNMHVSGIGNDGYEYSYSFKLLVHAPGNR